MVIYKNNAGPFAFHEKTGNPSEIPFGVCVAEFHGTGPSEISFGGLHCRISRGPDRSGSPFHFDKQVMGYWLLLFVVGNVLLDVRD